MKQAENRKNLYIKADGTDGAKLNKKTHKKGS